MANGTNGIDGYGNGYVNWYSNWKNRHNNSQDASQNNAPNNTPNYEEMQIDPNKVMDFLANNNYFIPIAADAAPAVDLNTGDAESEERIASYMERFEQIYFIVEQEFGAEFAPATMDLVMDKLMGMA